MTKYKIEYDKNTYLSYATKDTTKCLEGIGRKKTYDKKNSKYQLQKRNGGITSIKLHSYAAVKSFKSTLSAFEKYAKETIDVKNPRLKHVDKATVQGFLEKRLADGISPATLENDMANLNKFISAINVKDLANGNLAPIIENHRDVLNEVSKTFTHIKKPNRAFKNVNKIIQNISSDSAKAVAIIQALTGARIDDAINAPTKMSINGDTVSFKGSKGGKNYESVILPKKGSEKAVQNALTFLRNNPIKQSTYEKSLARACKSAGETETGSHSFRYVYAKVLVDSGLSDTQVSQSLGHEREEITQHYLRP